MQQQPNYTELQPQTPQTPQTLSPPPSQHPIQPIHPISQALITGTSSNSNYKKLQYEIKRAFVTHPHRLDNMYFQYLEESQQSVVVLNLKQKKYRVNSGVQFSEFQWIQRNCKRICEGEGLGEGGFQKIVTLEARGCDGFNFSKIVGKKDWQLWQKKRIFTRQYDVIVANKQYRIDFSNIDPDLTEPSLNNKQINVRYELLDTLWHYDEYLNCLRFKSNTRYNIDQFYYVEMSKIYQIDAVDAYEELYYVLVDQEESGEVLVDQYIEGVLNRFTKQDRLRYEVELRLTSKGIQKMIELREDMEGLCDFVGNGLLRFRDLSSINQNQSLSLTFISRSSLNQSFSLDLSVL